MEFDRIIPASAGQTRSRARHRRHTPDHPRECGANHELAGTVQCRVGSSPRVRGKRADRERWPGRHPDHPRECGANWDARGALGFRAGSSPRVRGKLGDAGGLPSSHRIIPASAGQTKPATAPTIRPADHPRECGANRPTICVPRWKRGSSPRVRGKQLRLHQQLGGVRIIPASAGQTHVRRDDHRAGADHPRECGAIVMGVLVLTI